MKERVFIALGSNLGDRLGYLKAAINGLPDVVATSSVYETEPVGGPDNQGPYLNMVVELVTEFSPRDLLEIAHKLEAEAGRVRTEINGPRTLDVDLLLYGSLQASEPDLEIPHPRMWTRRFVLQPLSELAPELLPVNWESSATGKVWIYNQQP